MQIVNIEAGESDSPNVHKVKASLASYGKRYLKKIYGKGNEQAILDKKSRKSSETDPMDDQLAKNKSGKGMKDHKQDMDYVKQINRVENSINNTSYEQNSISMISKQSTVENEKSVILEYGKTDQSFSRDNGNGNPGDNEFLGKPRLFQEELNQITEDGNDGEVFEEALYRNDKTPRGHEHNWNDIEKMDLGLGLSRASLELDTEPQLTSLGWDQTEYNIDFKRDFNKVGKSDKNVGKQTLNENNMNKKLNNVSGNQQVSIRQMDND